MADVKLSHKDFYVYALFRHDTGEPFYIGKGRRQRIDRHCWEFGTRNDHKDRIVKAALAATGDLPRVKLATGLSEDQAYSYEKLLISALGKHPKGPLVNLTDGGKAFDGVKPSKEVLKRAGLLRRGRPISEVTREKLRISHTGLKQSPEHIEARMIHRRGRKHPPEVIAKMSAAHRGKIYSVESRIKMSLSKKKYLRAVQLASTQTDLFPKY